MPKRVVLAYSGGLDTSVAVRWMIEELGVEVDRLAVDVGQASDDWDVVRERARGRRRRRGRRGRRPRRSSPRTSSPPPSRPTPCTRAATRWCRPCRGRSSCKHLVETARYHGADAVAHGCTGKGNDQVRFEVSTRALAPDLEVIAPVRGWGMTREESILYAYGHDIPILATKEKVYSIDDNLWGRAIECGEMEDPWAVPPPGRVAADQADRRPSPGTSSSGSSRACPSSIDGEELGHARGHRAR